MKTKKTLSCYTFSNLLVGICCFNFLITDSSLETVRVNNSNLNTLRKIYEIEVEVPKESVSVTNNLYTVSVSKKEVSSQNIQYIKPSYNSLTGKNVVNYAKHYLGLKYVHAGNSLTTGTDCSGFTKLIYKEFGISLGRTVSSQTYSGQYVKKSDLQPGDLVFYGYTNYATHVGIYMGDGLVIHQSNPNDGVKINSVDMMVYITARRVIFEDVVSKDLETNKSEDLEESKNSSDNKEIIQEEDSKIEDKKEEISNNEEVNKEEIDNKQEVNKEDLTNNSKDNNDTLNSDKENEDSLNNDKENKDSLEIETSEEEILDKPLEETNEIKDNSEVVLDKVESENIDISIENNEVEKENETLESSEKEEEKLAETKIEVKEELEKDTLK